MSHIYLPYVGGVQVYLENIAKALIKKGVDVDIITGTLNRKERKISVEEQEGIRIFRVPHFHISRYANKISGKSFFRSLKKIISRTNPDIIVFQNLFKIHPNFSLSGYLAALEKNIPTVHRIHTTVGNPNNPENFIVSQVGWDMISPVCKSISEDLLYNKKIDVKNITTIYNGVDIEKFRPNSNKRIRRKLKIKDNDLLVLHASRLVNYSDKKSCMEDKGVLNLLKSFSLLSQIFPSMKLLIATPKIIGNRKLVKTQEKQIKMIYDTAHLNGIRDRVMVISYLPNEMPTAYSAADIVVLASRFEACSTVYLEAMACEKPVIGTSVGGTPEIIDNGINGYLVEPDSPVDLSKRLIWLAQNKNKRHKFGKNGRKKVISDFNIDKIANQIIGVYGKLIKN